MTEPSAAISADPGDPWQAIAWDEPGFADLTWEWDDMHTPRALTRLSQSYLEALASGMNARARRLGFPMRNLPKIFCSKSQALHGRVGYPR